MNSLRVHVLLGSLILFVIGFACNGETAKPRAVEVIYREDFGCSFPQLEQSVAGIRALGKVEKETLTEYVPGGDLGHVFEFDGLTIELRIDRKSRESGGIQYANIRKGKWTFSEDARVGMKVSALLTKLKVKSLKNPEAFKVCGDQECATFKASNGRIVQIEYACYTG